MYHLSLAKVCLGPVWWYSRQLLRLNNMPVMGSKKKKKKVCLINGPVGRIAYEWILHMNELWNRSLYIVLQILKVKPIYVALLLAVASSPSTFYLIFIRTLTIDDVVQLFFKYILRLSVIFCVSVCISNVLILRYINPCFIKWQSKHVLLVNSNIFDSFIVHA